MHLLIRLPRRDCCWLIT